MSYVKEGQLIADGIRTLLQFASFHHGIRTSNITNQIVNIHIIAVECIKHLNQRAGIEHKSRIVIEHHIAAHILLDAFIFD